jgi:hypothetical protein
VVVGVVAVAPEAGQVDPPDEGDPVVDDDELLVVAVGEALVPIEDAVDPRPPAELLPALADLGPGGLEHRQGSPGPDEDPDGHPLGELPEQPADGRGTRCVAEAEVGLDVPAGDVDVGLGPGERGGDPREGLGPVHQHLDRVARPRRRAPGAPEAVARGVERGAPAQAGQPTPVMPAGQPFDRVADPLVEAPQRAVGQVATPLSPYPGP